MEPTYSKSLKFMMSRALELISGLKFRIALSGRNSPWWLHNFVKNMYHLDKEKVLNLSAYVMEVSLISLDMFSSQFCSFIPNKSVCVLLVLFYLLSILVLLQHACNVHYFKTGPISFCEGITLFLLRYIFNFHSFYTINMWMFGTCMIEIGISPQNGFRTIVQV